MGAIGTADRISTEFELLYSISGRKPAIREPTWMDMISSYIIANIILYTFMIYVELCRHTTSLSQTLYVKHGTCVDHIQLEMTELIHAVCGSAKMPLASASLLHSVLDCFKLLWSSCVFTFVMFLVKLLLEMLHSAWSSRCFKASRPECLHVCGQTLTNWWSSIRSHNLMHSAHLFKARLVELQTTEHLAKNWGCRSMLLSSGWSKMIDAFWKWSCCRLIYASSGFVGMCRSS